MTGKVALITGITGQDGSYLAEFLLMEGAFFRGETTKTVFGGEEIDEGSMTRADYADIVEAEVVYLERALDVRITSDWRSSLVE